MRHSMNPGARLALLFYAVLLGGCNADVGFHLTKSIMARPETFALDGIQEVKAAVRSEDRQTVRICILARIDEREAPAEVQFDLPVATLGRIGRQAFPTPEIPGFRLDSLGVLEIEHEHLRPGCFAEAGDVLPIVRRTIEHSMDSRFDLEAPSSGGEVVYEVTAYEGFRYAAFVTSERTVLGRGVVAMRLVRILEPRGPGIKVVLLPFAIVIDLITHPIQMWRDLTGWRHD